MTFTVFPLQATILSECSSYVGCKLSRFDSQLRLGIAKKTQVDDFAGRYFTRDFIAAPGLLDDQFQAVLGHRPVVTRTLTENRCLQRKHCECHSEEPRDEESALLLLAVTWKQILRFRSG